MKSEAAAYYHWPAFWVGSGPESRVDIDVSSLADEVFRTRLAVGIDVRVLREGMFVFGFSDYLPGRALPLEAKPDFDASATVIINRVRVMNAHLACLNTAIVKLQNYSHDRMVVNPSDLIALGSFEDSLGGTGSAPRLAALSTSRFPSTYREGLPPSFDWRLTFRDLVVETATVEESFRLLDTILDHASANVLVMCDLYSRSCKAYEEHNYSLCLVTAWAVVESLLQELWRRYLEDNRRRTIDGEEAKFINVDRKRTLEDGRSFTASVVSEMLSLSDRLPFHIYKDLSMTRKTRNSWIHSLEPVSRESALLSVQVAEQMLTLVEGVALETALTSRLHG